MRVATDDGLLTLFYDGSKELSNEDLEEEWYNEYGIASFGCFERLDLWEDWNVSDECNKKYKRERKMWQQVIVCDGDIEILRNTFYQCKSIKKVIFADSVIRIKRTSFSS